MPLLSNAFPLLIHPLFRFFAPREPKILESLAMAVLQYLETQ
ncbi:hypothetical protein BVRB_1g023020 [Beta vulgaris subsp. vulgaris]|uniref:Uncharacterized protein n=1 Tax=Beta vulgaris subsp. vulgaris TaxID=3555 RepID=A0A0J8BF31_BETVV|nr:hypothetical protein BVRB_1g023020 [Beta vulgaris subsp. vulgaris]